MLYGDKPVWDSPGSWRPWSHIVRLERADGDPRFIWIKQRKRHNGTIGRATAQLPFPHRGVTASQVFETISETITDAFEAVASEGTVTAQRVKIKPVDQLAVALRVKQELASLKQMGMLDETGRMKRPNDDRKGEDDHEENSD